MSFSACRGAADGLLLHARTGGAAARGAVVPRAALPRGAGRRARRLGRGLGRVVVGRARRARLGRRVRPGGGGPRRRGGVRRGGWRRRRAPPGPPPGGRPPGARPPPPPPRKKRGGGDAAR